MEMPKIYILVNFILITQYHTDASENLSLNKPANQSSLYVNGLWTADLAVDGCKRQQVAAHCCIHTSVQGLREAWWQVDLQQEAVIDNVVIYYRSGWVHRLGGYEIYLSNTSDWGLDNRCYMDHTPTKCELPSIQNNTCQGTGQYLTIYVDRRVKLMDWYSTNAILELCEVEVYGCPVGRYGNGDCASTCDGSCWGGICDPVTGTCRSCESGSFKDGHKCTTCRQHCPGVCEMETGACHACPDGTFGDLCEPCPRSCKGVQCDQEKGYCLNGCEDGNFGSYCNKTCPLDCRGKVCEQTAGTCAGCSSGKYGYTCDKTCPTCCHSNRCLQADGTCEDVPVKDEECFVLKVIFPVLLALVIAVCILIIIRIKQKYSPTSSSSKQTASYFVNKGAMEMDQTHVYTNTASVKD